MEVTIDKTDADSAIAKLKQFSALLAPAAAKSLYQDAEAVMTTSKEECPVKTGNLRATGHVELPVIDGASVTVLLGYGDTAVDYAEYVHEDLEAHHGVGKAKYLEDPLRAAQDQINANTVDAIMGAADAAGL